MLIIVLYPRDWHLIYYKKKLCPCWWLFNSGNIIQQVLVREKDPAIYYEYWMPRQAQLYRMTVDAFASDAQRVVSARPTVAPTTNRPSTTPTRRISTSRVTTTTTTARPITTTTPASVAFHRNDTGETDLSDWDQYEPQPTAASLVRRPPRMTYGSFMIPFFGSFTTTTTTTTTTTPRTTTTASAPTKKSRSRGSKKSKAANGVHNNIEDVRHHLGLIHKKHPKKSSAVRSGVKNNGQSHQTPCSVDGSCWKTVNGKKHFCLSEFGNFKFYQFLIRFYYVCRIPY